MIDRIAKLLTILAILLLAASGLLLAVGQNPENHLTNYQADSLALIAYYLLAVSWLLTLWPTKSR